MQEFKGPPPLRMAPTKPPGDCLVLAMSYGYAFTRDADFAVFGGLWRGLWRWMGQINESHLLYSSGSSLARKLIRYSPS